MKKRIIGIILVVCALLTAFLGIKAAGNASGNQRIINDAVYVADGKVLPENEGKVVVVNGTLEAPLPFVDEETGIELNSIVAYRHVEKARVVLGNDGKADTWSWDSTISENDLGGSKKIVAPGVTLGEFEVAEMLLQPVPTFAELTEFYIGEDYDIDWYIFEEKGLDYLYQLEYMPWNGDKVYYDTVLRDHVTSKQKNEGTLRVRYDVVEEGTSMDYTIIGRQKNGKLEEVEELDLVATVSGHLTPEEMLGHAESSNTTALITAAVIALAFAIPGVIILLKAFKGGQPTVKSKKRT
jgi:hypothetical protein